MRRDVEPSPVVLITSPDPYKLKAMLDREVGRRSMIVRSAVVETVPGLWVVEVVQLRPFVRPWVKPAAVVTGCVAVLGGSVAAGWWLLSILVDAVAGAAAVFGAAALGIMVVLALVGAATRSRSAVDVSVKVRVR